MLGCWLIGPVIGPFIPQLRVWRTVSCIITMANSAEFKCSFCRPEALKTLFSKGGVEIFRVVGVNSVWSGGDMLSVCGEGAACRPITGRECNGPITGPMSQQPSTAGSGFRLLSRVAPVHLAASRYGM